MEEKLEEVLKKYPLEITGKKRIRGAVLLETKDGLFTIGQSRESEARLVQQEKIKKSLSDDAGFLVDNGVKNEEGEFLTKDSIGNRWFMKRWYMGRVCNLREREDVMSSAGHLAKLHCAMADVAWNRENESAEPKYIEVMERHLKEMKRVYNYIRTKKSKSMLEISMLNQFPYYYEQGEEALALGKKISLNEFYQKAVRQGRYCHGSYNYHNIFLGKDIFVANFSRMEPGIQVTDLYDFWRKILEKNRWDITFGKCVMEAYKAFRMPEIEEAKLLYTLFLFPEKFWKQMNFYYNGKKSWVSMKNMEKLQKIEEQEPFRKRSLTEIKGLLFL